MALIRSAAVLLPGLLNLQPERQHGLLFFPKNPQKKDGVCQTSIQAASLENAGVQETPFLTPHNNSLLRARIYSNFKKVVICAVPPQTHPPSDTHTDNSKQVK